MTVGLGVDRRPPLLKYLPFSEAEERVLGALKKLLALQRGRRATVRARHVLLIMWGKTRKNVDFRAHMYDLFLTTAILRETPEIRVNGTTWILKKTEYKDGWVFTYVRAAPRVRRVGRSGSRRRAA